MGIFYHSIETDESFESVLEARTLSLLSFPPHIKIEFRQTPFTANVRGCRS
jgi:hypothetical protein